jgi:hypothetical protein
MAPMGKVNIRRAAGESRNSIFEGTFRKDVTGQIFMFFGKKLDNQIAIKWKNYEDSLVDIKVTHSPRFFINMDLEKEDTIMSKINQSYSSFRVMEPLDKTKILKDFVKTSLEEGESLWWLDETNDESLSPKLKDFRFLQPYQKQNIQVEALVLFPEIFSNRSAKYLNTSIYLLQEYQLITSSLRDIFSSGGQCDIVLNEVEYKVPKIYGNYLVQKKYIQISLKRIIIS